MEDTELKTDSVDTGRKGMIDSNADRIPWSTVKYVCKQGLNFDLLSYGIYVFCKKPQIPCSVPYQAIKIEGNFK